MSPLEPRAGHTSDDTSVPAPFERAFAGDDPSARSSFDYAYPGDPSPPPPPYGPAQAGTTGDPFARYRREAAPVDEPTAVQPVVRPAVHPDAKSAVPSEVEAAAQPDVQPAASPRGPGRRRAHAAGKSSSKAGRNLPAAIAVGFLLGLIVLGSLVLWPPAFLGLIVLVGGVAVWEMSRAVSVTGARPPLLPLLAGTVLMVGLAWHGGVDSMVLGLVVTLLATILWRIADGWAALRRDLASSVLITVYVPFLVSFAMLLQAPDPGESGRWRVLCTLLAVVLSDTGGYATGVLLGRHKMAPSISPGKTWEGFAGSVGAAAVGSALLLYFLLDIQLYWGLLFGAVISIVAVVGDLGESMLKRDLKIKDMSNLLPGHGGLMDRLDSILVAVPVAYLLFAVIAANQP